MGHLVTFLSKDFQHDVSLTSFTPCSRFRIFSVSYCPCSPIDNALTQLEMLVLCFPSLDIEAMEVSAGRFGGVEEDRQSSVNLAVLSHSGRSNLGSTRPSALFRKKAAGEIIHHCLYSNRNKSEFAIESHPQRPQILQKSKPRSLHS